MCPKTGWCTTPTPMWSRRPTFFRDYADPDIRDRIPPLYVMAVAPGEADLIEHFRGRTPIPSSASATKPRS